MEKAPLLRDAGSRMHVLDWVEGLGGDFRTSLNTILQPTGIIVAPEGPWLPIGRSNPAEALLDRSNCPLLPPDISARLRKWWLAVDRPAASGPNWDLAAVANFPDGRRGLVLVEAKAHLGELEGERGPKRQGGHSNPANHERIAEAIRQARDGLGGEVAGVRISRDDRYQFSNRVAFAWKLANEGVPTVLVYLGFTGDESIGRLSRTIRDDASWRAAVAEHTEPVLDQAFWERPIDVSGTPLWLLVRSVPAQRQSPSRSLSGPTAMARRTPGEPSRHARVRGCLLGGAVGDALGAPVEFLSLAAIRRQFGPGGIRDFAPAYGRLGAITDDTQMTLFTAEGLLRAWMHAHLKGICDLPGVIHHAYLRWLLTQGEPSDLVRQADGWLIGVQALHARRAPGLTCLSALGAAEGFGNPSIARNDSKGCGGVMRVAPFGLLPPDEDDDGIFKSAADAAALTHGHPSGYLAAGYLAVAVAALARGLTLAEALDAADGQLRKREKRGEVENAVAAARALAAKGRPTAEDLETLGAGWVAEEALAIAICCALVARDFAEGVILAANHSGDSDSTAAITGNLLGTLWGEQAIPAHWLAALELRAEIMQLADDLHAAASGELSPEDAWVRYPGS